MSQVPAQKKLKLSAVTAAVIPTTPNGLSIDHDGLSFTVSRVDAKHPHSWRGTYVVVESDMTDYYTDSLGGIREWVRLCCEAAHEVNQQRSV